MWYDVIGCDMMCYDVTWCDMMRHDAIWCDRMWYDSVLQTCVFFWCEIAEDCVKSSQSLVGEPQCPCLCTSIVGRQGNGVLKWATTPHSHNMSLNWENGKPCEFWVTSFSTNVLNGFISHQSPRLQQSEKRGTKRAFNVAIAIMLLEHQEQLRSPWSIEFCGVLQWDPQLWGHFIIHVAIDRDRAADNVRLVLVNIPTYVGWTNFGQAKSKFWWWRMAWVEIWNFDNLGQTQSNSEFLNRSFVACSCLILVKHGKARVNHPQILPFYGLYKQSIWVVYDIALPTLHLFEDHWKLSYLPSRWRRRLYRASCHRGGCGRGGAFYLWWLWKINEIVGFHHIYIYIFRYPTHTNPPSKTPRIRNNIGI